MIDAAALGVLSMRELFWDQKGKTWYEYHTNINILQMPTGYIWLFSCSQPSLRSHTCTCAYTLAADTILCSLHGLLKCMHFSLSLSLSLTASPWNFAPPQSSSEDVFKDCNVLIQIYSPLGSSLVILADRNASPSELLSNFIYVILIWCHLLPYHYLSTRQ